MKKTLKMLKIIWKIVQNFSKNSRKYVEKCWRNVKNFFENYLKYFIEKKLLKMFYSKLFLQNCLFIMIYSRQFIQKSKRFIQDFLFKCLVFLNAKCKKFVAVINVHSKTSWKHSSYKFSYKNFVKILQSNF